jgi:hypothetical protein
VHEPLYVQAELTHSGPLALATSVVQLVPHAPQLAVVFAKFVSQPFALLPSQFP